MVRSLLLVALLALAGCTAQPVNAPLLPVSPPTSGEAAQTEPSEPSEKKIGCDDLANVVEVPSGPPGPGGWAAVETGMTVCRYSGNLVLFTAESDEGSFAQRREKAPVWAGYEQPRFLEDPGFADEAYRSWQGAESIQKSIATARLGSVEVWTVLGPPGTRDRTELEEKIFNALFELLGAV